MQNNVGLCNWVFICIRVRGISSGSSLEMSTLMLSLMFSHVLLRTLGVLLLETDSSIPPDVLGAHSGGMTASQAILTSQLYSQDDQTEVCPPFARG